MTKARSTSDAASRKRSMPALHVVEGGGPELAAARERDVLKVDQLLAAITQARALLFAREHETRDGSSPPSTVVAAREARHLIRACWQVLVDVDDTRADAKLPALRDAIDDAEEVGSPRSRDPELRGLRGHVLRECAHVSRAGVPPLQTLDRRVIGQRDGTRGARPLAVVPDELLTGGSE